MSNSIPKRKPIRSPKLLQSARGQECQCHTPACGGDPATVVAAHSNWPEHGKSMGRKADDLFIAYACSGCHRYIDDHQHGAKEYWTRGHARTLILLVEQDLIKVK